MRGLDLRAVVAVALVLVVAVSALRAPAPSDPVRILLGTSGLIDGYHVDYRSTFQAEWNARQFWLSSQGIFWLVLRNAYISEEPRYFFRNGTLLALTFVGSATLLQARAVFVNTAFGDRAYYGLHSVVATTCNPSGARICESDLRGSFDVPARESGPEELSYIEIQLSWVRVFRDTAGSFYFQWLQGDIGQSGWSDQTLRSLHGRYLAYYPVAEDQTTPLLPEGFDYVGWLKTNLPGLS